MHRVTLPAYQENRKERKPIYNTYSKGIRMQQGMPVSNQTVYYTL